MKLLILMLVLAISAQPVQAGICDMDMGQDTSHHPEQSKDSDHDCCDPEQSESPQGCDMNMHCGSCSANGSPPTNALKTKMSWAKFYSLVLESGVVLPSHSSPPFRPPIS